VAAVGTCGNGEGMTNFNLVFDADSFIRTEARRAVGYALECDVAISLMWQVPYADGDCLT
jgi:hypothetical protein